MTTFIKISEQEVVNMNHIIRAEALKDGDIRLVMNEGAPDGIIGFTRNVTGVYAVYLMGVMFVNAIGPKVEPNDPA